MLICCGGWRCLLLSCVVPIGIFVGRNNIRAFRREIVRDLERLFSFAQLPNGAPLIIPSFRARQIQIRSLNRTPIRDEHDDPHRFFYYLLPVSIFVILTALGFRMAFTPYKLPYVPELFHFPAGQRG